MTDFIINCQSCGRSFTVKEARITRLGTGTGWRMLMFHDKCGYVNEINSNGLFIRDRDY